MLRLIKIRSLPTTGGPAFSGFTHHQPLVSWSKVIPASIRATGEGGKSDVSDDLGSPNIRESFKEDESGDLSRRARGRRTTCQQNVISTHNWDNPNMRARVKIPTGAPRSPFRVRRNHSKGVPSTSSVRQHPHTHTDTDIGICGRKSNTYTDRAAVKIKAENATAYTLR